MRSSIISCIMVMLSVCQLSVAEDIIRNDSCDQPVRQRDTRRWQKKIIPSQVVGQNAGNMGVFSLGVGWDYGRRRQCETHVLVGFIPKSESKSAKVTLTLKENYIPWRLSWPHGFLIEPAYAGVYFNAIFGGDFWNHQPHRYPNNYYWFSTQLRTNVFVGQRLTKPLHSKKRRWVKSATVFYELSSCDLYLIDAFTNRHLSLWDVVGLSVGVKLQVR